VPTAGNQSEQGSEQPAKQPLAGEKDVQFVLAIIFPALRPPQSPKHTNKHDEIDHRDSEKKNHRDQRANQTAGLDQTRKAPVKGAGGQGDQQRCRDHHSRMAEQKKKPSVIDRLHQFARDIVDRGYVVGIDRVPQPEAVSDKRRRQQQGIAVKRCEGPDPGEQICGDQDKVKPEHFGPDMVGSIIE
jgi:hypothetical protein